MAVGAASLLAVGTADAATLTVTTTSDETAAGDQQCSLREAISAVAAPGGATDCGTAANAGNTIVLGPNTYSLSIQPSGTDNNSTGDLDVQSTTGLTIEGAGMGTTVISAAGLKDRLLRVASGDLTLQNLTLSDGHAPDGADGVSTAISGLPPTAGQPGSDGGAISNAGTVNLDHVALSNNSAGSGGAGGNSNTSVPASGAAGGNGGRGGAVYNAPAAVLNLTAVTLSANRSGNGGPGGGADGTSDNGGGGGCCGDGGGLFNDGGTVDVAASTFNQNIAGDGGAGGFGGNPMSGTAGAGGTGQGGASGGAIATVGGSLTITNSTISENLSGSGGNGGQGGIGGIPAQDGAGGNAGNGSAGGGIFARAGSSVALTNVTIAQNQSGGPGTPGAGRTTSGSPGLPAQAAGVFVNGATVTAKDTLLASNAVGNCGGPTAVTDGHNNLSFPGSGCPGGFLTGDPRLAPLRDNGGPTQTMGLGAGSAAIDQGAGCPASDQRGAARPSGPACDIGAYELVLPVVSTGPASPVTSSGATLSGSVIPNQSSASASFQYGTTTAYGSTTPIQQGGGFAPITFSAQVSGLAPNTTYHYRLVATSPDGTAGGSDQTFTTGAAPSGPAPPVGGSPGPPPAGGSGPPLPGNTSAPKLAHLTLNPRSFRTARRRHHRRDKLGTSLAYTDTKAATATFTVSRCAKFDKRRRCLRYMRVGTFSHADVSGPNAFHWNGLLGRTRVKPGRYRLSVEARLATRKSNALSSLFTVLR